MYQTATMTEWRQHLDVTPASGGGGSDRDGKQRSFSSNSLQIPKQRHPLQSIDTNGVVHERQEKEAQSLTVFEQLQHELANDETISKEITLGKRVGFYRIRGEIGRGNFSHVKLASHILSRERVAIKILDKTKLDAKTQRLLSREISSMERLHHPNVIRLYEVLETTSKLHIVMEYASGGELYTKITNEGKLSERTARVLLAQLVSALEHLHSQQIIHRDLKAENVFFATPSIVKLGDFGFSTFSKADQALFTFCGSPPYAAPELFNDDSYYGSYVDIWALGIMLYFMVTGIMPFRSDTVSKLKKLILAGDYSIPPFISDSCRFLIRGVLRQMPADRFTLEQIRRSNWLEDQHFPCPLEEYEMNPKLSSNHNLRSDEMEAIRLMAELGINENHILQAQGCASRSTITGTYRIILHKIQRQRNGDLKAESQFLASAQTLRSTHSNYNNGRQRSSRQRGADTHLSNEKMQTDRKVSKLCVLL